MRPLAVVFAAARGIVCAGMCAAGCSSEITFGDGSRDAGVVLVDGAGGDLTAPWLFGKYASQFALNLKLESGSDAGTSAAGVKIFALWATEDDPDGGAAYTVWELCDVPIPGLVDVPDDQLNQGTIARAVVTHGAGTTTMSQPEVAIVIGAQLGLPASDPLPTDASRPCGGGADKACVLVNPENGMPGIPVPAAGLFPDADVLYLDLRVKFSFAASLTWEGRLDGTMMSAAIESHVLACHLRAGGLCKPTDISRLESMHPRVTFTGGMLRSLAQGPYFTCPIFLDDPEGALSGNNTVVDAGAADLSVSHVTFSTVIQADLDARGCATGGCHETFTKPGQMRLVFHPQTAALVMQNYKAALPWTTGLPAGGRFVNQVPLPAAMRARWIAWVNAGAPF